MKALKTLKMMFKILDTKGDREICKVLHCCTDKDSIIVVATNGHILLKTTISKSDLDSIVDHIPPLTYFSIRPDKLKTGVCEYSRTYYDTVMKVIPDVETLEVQEKWTAFDSNYMKVASDFLAHCYDAKSFNLTRPYVGPSKSTTSAHVFGHTATDTIVVLMPLRIEA